MNNFEFWGTIISSFAWPVSLIVLVLIFKKELSVLIGSIKSIRSGPVEFQVGPGDVLDLSAAVPQTAPTHQYIQVKSIPSAEAFGTPTVMVGAPKLSEEEIERSRQVAQRRLDEDTKRVGYQRGELFRRDDGVWAIRWGGKYPL